MSRKIAKELLPKGYAKRTAERMIAKGITVTDTRKKVNPKLVYNVVHGAVEDNQVLSTLLELIEEDKKKRVEMDRKLANVVLP